MVDISISSGWMFAHGKDTFSEQQGLIELADGVELSVTRSERFSTYNVPLDADYISFHIAPESDHISAIESLADNHDPSAVVIHPDAASKELLSTYADLDMPLSIENMDIRRKSGFTVDELEGLLEAFDASFTLDVQHAYEHDASMDYAWDLVEMADDRLAELHVSGETEDNIHSLIHKADNREAILSFLREFYAEGRDVPLVIEGEYESAEDVRTELTTLRETVE